MMSSFDVLSELSTTMDEKGDLGEAERRRFWKVVGEIKREENPDPEVVKLAGTIRDRLYEKRLGGTFPHSLVLVMNTAGVGFVISSVLFSDPSLYPLGIVLSNLSLAIFFLTYAVVHGRMVLGILITLVMVLAQTLLDLFLLQHSEGLLVAYNQLLLLAAIPSLYLNGRVVGARIAGIKLDGVSRDVFGLLTMKINYETYLSASPPKRMWIFLCGGLGTVLTGLAVSLIALVVFSNPWFFLFPVLLFCAEVLDYLGLAGKLSGGEFHHLRRERRIVRDWRSRKMQSQ